MHILVILQYFTRHEEYKTNCMNVAILSDPESINAANMNDLNIDQLKFLKSKGFTYSQMAKMYRVHRTTISSQLSLNAGMGRYSEISDDALETKIKSIIVQSPQMGRRMIIGHLVSKGIFVQRHCVTTLLKALNPVGMAYR